jgi:hypothetical protein
LVHLWIVARNGTQGPCRTALEWEDFWFPISQGGPDRVRWPGASRKRLVERDPELAAAFAALVDPDTRGDPESPLRWTCKSTTQLARALTAQGHPVSPDTVGRLLKQQGYTLQRTRKTLEGAQHPDRDGQFSSWGASIAIRRVSCGFACHSGIVRLPLPPPSEAALRAA